MARPSDYSPELAAKICERLADGESLKSICTADDMPSKASVYVWLTKHSEFLDMYTRAREDQADTLADEIIDIADDASRDTKTITRDDGSEYDVCNTEWINRSRLRVDARKWVAAKLKPKKYGERIDHTLAVNPISMTINLDPK
jgi:hypothetical protein